MIEKNNSSALAFYYPPLSFLGCKSSVLATKDALELPTKLVIAKQSNGTAFSSNFYAGRSFQAEENWPQDSITLFLSAIIFLLSTFKSEKDK